MRRTASGSTWPRVIGDSVQPGATALTRARGATRGTSFLSDRSSPRLQRRLRRRVVGVAGLAEATRGRADEHEGAVAVARDLAQERARRQERGGQVLAERLLPARERELPDGHVLGGPDAGDGRAHVDRARASRARSSNSRVDIRLARQVRLGGRRAADLGGDCRGPLLAAVVVDEHVRALGGEETGAGRADAAGGAGDDHALPCEARVHEGQG